MDTHRLEGVVGAENLIRGSSVFREVIGEARDAGGRNASGPWCRSVSRDRGIIYQLRN